MEQPLAGKTVVVTRASSQASDFVAALESRGARVIHCPTIQITDPDDYSRLDQAIEDLFGYDWLIFTSTNAVEYFLKRLIFLSKQVDELDALRICAIGEATAEVLIKQHVHVDVVPSESRAEGVFAALVDYVGGRE